MKTVVLIILLLVLCLGALLFSQTDVGQVVIFGPSPTPAPTEMPGYFATQTAYVGPYALGIYAPQFVGQTITVTLSTGVRIEMVIQQNGMATVQLEAMEEIVSVEGLPGYTIKKDLTGSSIFVLEATPTSTP